MRMNHGFLFLGLGLLSAGAVALAIQANLVDQELMANAWHLWPLVLVAIGLLLILSRTRYAVVGTVLAAVVIGAFVSAEVSAVGAGLVPGCGSPPATADTQGGSFGGAATLDWRLSCATLDVAMGSSSNWSVSWGEAQGGAKPTVDGTATGLRLASLDQGADLFADRGERWVVILAKTTTYEATVQANGTKLTMNLSGSHFASLSLKPNATDAFLDLSDASIQGLDLAANAGSVTINTSGGTAMAGTIDVNAGSVHFCTTPGAAFQFTMSGTAMDETMNGSGITQVGDTWESATYPDADAAHRITLAVHGNAASFELNPSGGC